MWPSLANQSYLLARVIASRMVYVTYVGPGRAFPRTSEGTLRKMFSLSSVVIIWRDVSLSQNVRRAFIMGESDMTIAKIRDGNTVLRTLFVDWMQPCLKLLLVFFIKW